MADKDEVDLSFTVKIRDEVVEVDPWDMTFAELDEVERLLRLIPNWSTSRARAAAQAFVVLKRSDTFAAWDDDKFRALTPRVVKVVEAEDGEGPGEA